MNSNKKGFLKNKISKLQPFIMGIMLTSGMIVGGYSIYKNIVHDEQPEQQVAEWHLVAKIDPLNPVGANDPDGLGWCEFFILDYEQDPDTYLQGNGTADSFEDDGDEIMGYADTDSWNQDLKSNDAGYFVCRCVFDETTHENGGWNYENYRVNLSVTGDETIDSEDCSVNSTNTSTEAHVSSVCSNRIYINFYWDDESDGYRILDNGSLDVVIEIFAKY